MKSDRWIRWVFWWAGAFGVLVLIPLYFTEGRYGLDHPPAITHPEFYYGFAGVGLAWQIAFFIVATNPVRYRAFMIPSILEKISFCAAIAVLWMQSRVPMIMVEAAVVDFIWAIFFCLAYLKTSEATTRANARGFLKGD